MWNGFYVRSFKGASREENDEILIGTADDISNGVYINEIRFYFKMAEFLKMHGFTSDDLSKLEWKLDLSQEDKEKLKLENIVFEYLSTDKSYRDISLFSSFEFGKYIKIPNTPPYPIYNDSDNEECYFKLCGSQAPEKWFNSISIDPTKIILKCRIAKE